MLSHRTIVSTILALAFAMLGCGGDGGKKNGPKPGDGTTPGTSEPVKIDMATVGTIQGTVKFEGTPPEAKSLEDDFKSKPHCHTLHPNAKSEEVVVNPNKTLKNVIVYVKSGLPKGSFPVPSEAKTVDQKGCTYVPHVMTLQTSQKLKIKNSDQKGVDHNVKALNRDNPNDQLYNVVKNGPGEDERTISKAQMVALACNVHSWMNGTIGVFDHPYHFATGDDGTFTLKDLPPGDYVIEAWHEFYDPQEQKVTLKAKGTEEVTFTFKAD